MLVLWQQGTKVANQLTLGKESTLEYPGEPDVIMIL